MFNINDKVKIKDTNLYGKIIEQKNNTCIVKVNNKEIKLSEDKIELFDYKECDRSSKITYDICQDYNSTNEIMLRHKTKEDAIFELDKFIDSCIVNKINVIRIVHGKNGGILREAVHEYLKNNNSIESYRLGGYFEGQFGVTIAVLK